MNINNSPLPLPNTTDLYQSQEAQTAQRTEQASRTAAAGAVSGSAGSGDTSNDDVHLSELVRSLRSLASDSPDRQVKIEQLARSHAGGNYRVDPHATAQGIIDDSFKH